MYRLVSLLILLSTTSLAFADINIPEEIQSPPNPVVATVDADIPKGAQSKGRWEIEGTADANLIEISDHEIHVWAQPGIYTLSYTGMWVDFENKTFDFIDEEAQVKVTVEDSPDPPDPDPPEPNPGPKQVMMFYRQGTLDNMPVEQRTLLNSLSVRTRLEEQGHAFREVVILPFKGSGIEEYESWLKAVEGEDMPRVAWAPKKGGKIKHKSLPDNFSKLAELLGGE